MGKYLPFLVDIQRASKILKYVSLFFVFTMVVTTFTSCGSGGDSQDDNVTYTDTSSGGMPTNVVLYDPKSLFLSDTDSSQVAAAYQSNSIEYLQAVSGLTTGEYILYQITQDDEILEVTFFDESGNMLDVMTTYIEYLNSSFVYIEFKAIDSYMSSTYYALINLENGTIYDLSELCLGGFNDILGITNNLLFLISDYTLYKIDLSTMVATPMNNPEYDPVGLYLNRFIYYNEALNKSYVAIHIYEMNSGDLIDFIKVYCTDNSSPVETIFEYDSDMAWIADNHKIYSGNNVYFVNGVFSSTAENEISEYLGGMGGSLDLIEIYQISIDDTKIPTMKLVSTTDLQSDPPLCSERIIDTTDYTQIDSSTTCLFSKTGKISIISNNDSVTAQFESMDFSEISSGIYNEDYIYYELDDSIKRASISDGTTDTILADSDLIDWYITGDFIFYIKYITATQVNTYKTLKDGTGSPELVSNSDMEMIQIVELTL